VNLKRRLALGSTVSIAVMCIVAAMSYVLLRAMEFSVLSVTEEYMELQDIDAAQIAFTDVELALTAEPPRIAEAIAALDGAETTLACFVELQHTHAGGDASHHAEETEVGERLRTTIEDTRAVLRGAGADLDVVTRAQAAAQLDRLRSDLNILATGADRLVSDSLEATHRQLAFATTALVTSCAVGAIIVVILAFCQHRWVVLPISSLRNRVRQSTGTRSDTEPVRSSPDVLSDLDRGFDGLIRELDELYGTLEDRVHTKSRELVQSERLASVGYLAAGVAHEINNPLNAILGYAELTLRDLSAPSGNGRPAADSVESLRIIRDETMRCKHIVEKLLSLVRKSDAPREAVDMIAVIREVVAVVDRLKQFRGRTVVPELPDHELVVFAREAEMKQILLNLIINALAATSPGDGRVTIVAGGCEEAVRVCVHDNGHGMPPETIDRVFEPFFSETRSENGPGTGLGLSIVHAIVLDHGGTIDATSDGPDKGSIFTISLPTMEAAGVASDE